MNTTSTKVNDVMKKNKLAALNSPWIIIVLVFLSRICHNIFMFSISGDIFSPHISKVFSYLVGYELIYFAILLYVFFGICSFTGVVSRLFVLNNTSDRRSFLSVLLTSLCFILILSDVLIPFLIYQFSFFFSNLLGGDELYRILLANYKAFYYVQTEVIEEYLAPFSLALICFYVAKEFCESLVLKRFSFFLSVLLLVFPFILALTPEDSTLELVLMYFGYSIYQLMFPFLMYLSIQATKKNYHA